MIPANSGDGERVTVSAVAQRQLRDVSGTLVDVPGQVELTASATTRPEP